MKKIKYGCDTSYATCIIVESTPNPQSSLLDVECNDGIDCCAI